MSLRCAHFGPRWRFQCPSLLHQFKSTMQINCVNRGIQITMWHLVYQRCHVLNFAFWYEQRFYSVTMFFCFKFGCWVQPHQDSGCRRYRSTFKSKRKRSRCLTGWLTCLQSGAKYPISQGYLFLRDSGCGLVIMYGILSQKSNQWHSITKCQGFVWICQCAGSPLSSLPHHHKSSQIKFGILP